MIWLKEMKLKRITTLVTTEVEQIKLTQKQTAIKGLYSGGTLASEAAVLISDALGLGYRNYK